MGRCRFKAMVAVVLAALLLCCTTHAFAQKTDQPTIRVVYPIQPGLTDIDENGNYCGYTYEYLMRIAQYTGWNYEFITFEGKTIDEQIVAGMEMVENGQADLITAIVQADYVKDRYDFTENSYGCVYTTLSILEGNTEITEDNFNQLKPLRIAVYEKMKTRISELDEYMKSRNATYELVVCKNMDELPNMLAEDKADAMLDVSLNITPGMKTIARFAARPYYIATTKGNTELLEQIDTAIESIRVALPYYQQELYQQYFGISAGGFHITPEEQEYFNEKKSLRALCFPNAAPFVFADEGGKMHGSTVSLLNAFAETTGLTVEYVLFDDTKTFEEVWGSGEYDCILGIPINDTYNARFGVVTSMPYTRTDLVRFSKEKHFGHRDADCTIALVKGSNLVSVLRQHGITEEQILYFDDMKECVQAVKDGTAAIGYGNRSSVAYYNYDLFANLVISPLLGYTQNIEMSLSNKSDTVLISILNRYIRNLSDSELSTYYSIANTAVPKSEMELFARSNPFLTIGICSLMISAFLVILAMFFAARKLKTANVRLTASNRAKDDFLSQMSHDMRTPMNAIIGFSQFGLESDNIQELRNFHSKINESGKFLLGLINDVLDMSKMDNGKMQLNPEPYHLSEFVNSISAILSQRAEEKKIDFIVTAPKEIPQVVMVDKLHIQQIFINLLGNAIKFTPENGKVELAFSSVPLPDNFLRITFIVRDNGIGMNDAFQHKMYQPFEQDMQAEVSDGGGTGLGLSIVKRLVDLMGGTITCKSKLNEGTEFIVVLDAPIVADRELLIEPEQIVSESTSLAGKRILLCEDHPINAQVAIRLLEKKGMIVALAQNGKIGVETFAEQEEYFYDAILMDIRMPVMDGLTAAKEIRKMEREDAKTIPIIALSANAYEEDKEKSKNAGINAHLSKPVEPELLYKTLDWCIAEKKKK